jgi:hypothetical protein
VADDLNYGGLDRAAGQRFRDLQLRQGGQDMDRPETVNQFLNVGGCGIIGSHQTSV